MDDMLDDLFEDSQEPKEEHEFPCCPFLRERCSRIHDFLRFSVWKGRPRTPGKLSVTTDRDLWILSITDLDRSRSFTITGTDFVQCLESLDQCIATKQVRWRYWGNPTKGGAKKRTGTKV
jgi:hypothetical protein